MLKDYQRSWKMLYNDKHFFTTTQHIEYMKEIEGLNDIEIGSVLKKLWGCKSMEVASILDWYYKTKEVQNETV